MSKLTKLNLDPHPILDFKLYLRNRIHVCHSKWKVIKISEVVSGVPQGSVLGLLLFLIYINDIDLLNTNQNEGSLLFYADDLLLYHPISASACKYMTIHHENPASPPLPNMCLNISGSPLYLKLTTASTFVWRVDLS